jgi:hypothetical protein
MELIASYTATGSVSNIEFTSIPGTFTDLCVYVSSRGSSSGPAEANTIYFNGDTTNANYPAKRLLGSGSAASSDQTTTIKPGFFNNLAGTTASTFANSMLYIPNYAGSNSKSFSVDTSTENNGTEAYMAFVAGRWTGTAAITSIKFTPESAGNFVQYTTAYLYGVKNA